MDIRRLHEVGLGWFGECVKGVRDEAWDAPTPCSEWDVRKLVNHNVSENWWARELLAGRTIEEVGDRYDGDVLGDDPVEAYYASAEAARQATQQLEDLNMPVHVSYGPIPAFEYLQHRFTDLAVHGWDLAVATSQEAQIPRELVDAGWDVMSARREMVRVSGVFGEEVDVPGDADLQNRLLGLLGRDPSAWTG